MLQIVYYFEDIYDTVSSFIRWNSVSDNPGQNTSGHLSNFGRKVENLLYMLSSLYEHGLFFFRCLFGAPLPPRQCWNMPAIDERILILETVKNQHCNGGRGKSTNCPDSFDQDCLRKEFLDNWSQAWSGSLNLIRELSLIVKQYIAPV